MREPGSRRLVLGLQFLPKELGYVEGVDIIEIHLLTKVPGAVVATKQQQLVVLDQAGGAAFPEARFVALSLLASFGVVPLVLNWVVDVIVHEVLVRVEPANDDQLISIDN